RRIRQQRKDVGSVYPQMRCALCGSIAAARTPAALDRVVGVDGFGSKKFSVNVDASEGSVRRRRRVGTFDGHPVNKGRKDVRIVRYAGHVDRAGSIEGVGAANDRRSCGIVDTQSSDTHAGDLVVTGDNVIPKEA